MVGREQDGVWITLKEVIHAAPEEVGSCVATASGLCRWLAVLAEYPPEVGARLELSWDRDWSRTTELKILAYEFDQGGHASDASGKTRVKWEWFPSPLDETPVPVEITVTPIPEGGARVIVRHGPFAEDHDTLLTVADSAESWRWYLCNLRSILESKHDMRTVRPL